MQNSIGKLGRRGLATFGAGLALTLVTATEAAAAVGPEIDFIFNTFSFLFHGVLVMSMAVGFAMLKFGRGSQTL